MNSLLVSFVRYCLLTPLAAVILIAACTRVTVENYARIDTGMSRDEVYEILGKPDEVSGGGLGRLSFSSEIWRGHKQTVSVTFSGDRVAIKSIRSTPAESD